MGRERGGAGGALGARLVALAEAIENGGDERQVRRAICEEDRLARAEALLSLEGRPGLARLVRGGGGGGRGAVGLSEVVGPWARVGSGSGSGSSGLKLSLGLGPRVWMSA